MHSGFFLQGNQVGGVTAGNQGGGVATGNLRAGLPVGNQGAVVGQVCSIMIPVVLGGLGAFKVFLAGQPGGWGDCWQSGWRGAHWQLACRAARRQPGCCWAGV